MIVGCKVEDGGSEQIDPPDELSDKRIGQPIVYLLRCSELLDAPPLMTAIRCLVRILGHEDSGDAELALDLHQLDLHVSAQLVIARSERLVHQVHAWIEGQRGSATRCCWRNGVPERRSKMARPMPDDAPKMHHILLQSIPLHAPTARRRVYVAQRILDGLAGNGPSSALPLAPSRRRMLRALRSARQCGASAQRRSASNPKPSGALMADPNSDGLDGTSLVE